MRPLIIGIAGGSGSGKSTVARGVADALAATSVAFIDMDAYYRNFAHLPMEERRRVNWDHPEALDVDLLVEQLEQLHAGVAVEKPTYDFVTHTRSPRTERIEPAPVIVIDGILLFTDARVRDQTIVVPLGGTLAPGAGTCLMVEAIVRNQGRVLPCSVELQGEFGVKGAFVGGGDIGDPSLAASQLAVLLACDPAALQGQSTR